VKLAGIDLAGMSKNPTGYCLLSIDGERKTVDTKIFYSDDDIVSQLELDKPALTAFDAPLVFENKERECDRTLREYGALPVTLSGMSFLAERGSELAAALRPRMELIEVSVKASCRILGVYHKDDFRYQKNLMGLDLDGAVNTKLLSRDELDAIVAAITAFLHKDGLT